MIEINNLTNFVLDKRSFSTVAKKVLKGENRETPARNAAHSAAGGETILSLAFVSKEEIKKLNKKFRKKNKATDVLSFSFNPKIKNQKSKLQFKIQNYLGEVVVCPSVVKENSLKYKVDFNKEMMKVFVHGILHLLGYEHEKSKKEAELMRLKEKKYLSKV